MEVEYVGGCADGKRFYVQLPLPDERTVYCPMTGYVDHYVLQHDLAGNPFYCYSYSGLF